MANLERMTVVFPEPMAAEIRAAVDAGEYASTSEAVRMWVGRRQWREDEVERLRAAWDRGKANGSLRPFDFDDLRREARKRLAEAKHAG